MHPILLFLALVLAAPLSVAEPFRTVSPGLELGEFAFPEKAPLGDSTVTVVRVDPAKARLRLVGGDRHTAREWAEREKLRVVVNAGMFQFGSDKPVGYARFGKTVLNGHHSKEHMTLAALPAEAGLRAGLLDDECDQRASLEPKYGLVLQGIRMIDCHRAVRWGAAPKRWSVVAVGADGSGRLLFVHCRSPYPMRQFAQMLLDLPLGLERLMYLEGGPEASLFVRAGDTTRDLFGSYETGFFESDRNDHPWPLPNVIGVE